MVKLTCPKPTSRCIWHSLGIGPWSRNSHPHRVPLYHGPIFLTIKLHQQTTDKYQLFLTNHNNNYILFKYNHLFKLYYIDDMEILLHQFQRKCPRQCNVVKYGIVVGATSMGNPKVYKALGKKHNMTLAETHTFIE